MDRAEVTGVGKPFRDTLRLISPLRRTSGYDEEKQHVNAQCNFFLIQNKSHKQ